jgi:DNA-binding MarR family transcriptional regulator
VKRGQTEPTKMLPPDGHASDVRGYFAAIAHARYLVRKVFRIVDEEAKRAGLDPLQHQALLQIYGLGQTPLMINQIAERLDIAPAFASRVVTSLEAQGFVARNPDARDRRVTLITATSVGVQTLRAIDEAVRVHVEYFQSQLDETDRMSALATFGFYVGLEPDSKVARTIRDAAAKQSR